MDRTPPNWKRPEDVMRLHKLRSKKRSLDFRLCNADDARPAVSKNVSGTAGNSKNPFRRSLREQKDSKKQKLNEIDFPETTSDGTLFRLLNCTKIESDISCCNQTLTFTNALSNSGNVTPSKKTQSQSNTTDEICVDWTLRVKVRLLSPKPFPWNQKLKTCEEASGITGFVRCIDTDMDSGKNMNLDTSPNARFHQCCLVWQHPSISWLELYPRYRKRAHLGNDPTLSVLQVKDTLYKTWLNSFRSLYQLVRAKQCPYFYLISNTFLCLFRAAGINGYPELNAIVTPTTRGFRQLLKEEDIEFSMPLKSFKGNNVSPANDSSDTGYDSLGLADELNETVKDELSDEETDTWLQNMGVEESEIKKLNSSQFELMVGKDKQIDNMPESLVFVEGVEAQALFNFLVNCKSIIPTTGSLSGVPPTLLAPVAFTGATLVPLQVRETKVKMNEICYDSIEIKGPILPHMVHNLCDLLRKSSLDKFSLTFANIDASQAFTSLTSYQIDTAPPGQSPSKTPRTPTIFGEQNLSDCGLKPNVLASFCQNNVKQFDNVKFMNGCYTCF